MTQLIGRLQDAGLADRAADPADGRVVQVAITGEGSALVARRRAVRAERLAGLLAQLSRTSGPRWPQRCRHGDPRQRAPRPLAPAGQLT